MIALAITTIALLAADKPIYLGILETSANPAVCAHSDPAIMRVAFQFADGRWTAMPHGITEGLEGLNTKFPAKVSWFLAFDGKPVGQVESLRSTVFERSCEVGTQRLIAPAKLPQFTLNASAFSTWLGAPPFRPIVAVSRPNYADPDHWEPFQPERQQFLALHGAFRKAVALPLRCEDEPVHNYPVSYIKPIAKGYRSASGKTLIGFLADAGQNACTLWTSSVWFLVDSEQATLIGMDITLLDAGDYDGDGSSELLFHMSAYNHDGYLLFRPRDGSKAQFSWQYH